jgi:hypothetical protein
VHLAVEDVNVPNVKHQIITIMIKKLPYSTLPVIPALPVATVALVPPRYHGFHPSIITTTMFYR